MLRRSPPSAPPPAATCRRRRPPDAADTDHRRPDAHLRPPHPHDAPGPPTTTRRMDAAGVRAARRAGVLAGPAAHQRRQRSPTTSTPWSAGSRSAPRQFGIAPPLHDRAQPQGGQRPALPRRCSTLLPRYLDKDGVVAVGEIGYDSMTAGGGRGVRRAARAGRRARPARAGAHPAPRQGARHRADPRRGPRVGHRAGARRRRPPQRGDRRGWSRKPAAGWASPSTRTPRWTRTRMVAHPAGVRHRADAGQLRRRLGQQRPAADPHDRRGDAGRRLHRRRRRPGAVAQPGGVLRPERAAGRSEIGRRRPPTFAGNSILRGGEQMRLRHPRRHASSTSRYCTNVHPAEDLDGVARRSSTRYARAGPRPRSASTGSGSACGWPRRSPRDWPPTPPRCARLRGELAARGLEVVTLNGFPYPAFQDPVVKHKVYRPDWTERPSACATPWTCARVLADLLPDRRRPRQRLDAAAGLAQPWTGRGRRGRRSLGLLAEGARRGRRTRTGREVRVGFEPEPGCVVETHRAGGRLAGRGGPATGSASASTRATSRSASRTRRRRSARLAPPGSPSSRSRSRRRCEAPDPADAETGGRCARFVEPRFLHQTRAGAAALPAWTTCDAPSAGGLPGAAPWRVHFHVPLHADRRRR